MSIQSYMRKCNMDKRKPCLSAKPFKVPRKVVSHIYVYVRVRKYKFSQVQKFFLGPLDLHLSMYDCTLFPSAPFTPYYSLIRASASTDSREMS